MLSFLLDVAANAAPAAAAAASDSPAIPLTGIKWLDMGITVVSTVAAMAGGWKGIKAIGVRLATKYRTEGAMGVMKDVPAVLGDNAQLLMTIYNQFKAVVKAIDMKEAAFQNVLKALPESALKTLRESTSTLGAQFSMGTLADIDLAAIPFKDIVNSKLVNKAGVNDEVLKALVTSARKDESAAVALDRVAAVAGAAVGEGLNIGAKVLTGGTVDIKDVVGFVSGVGSAALGAKSSG